jgi:hypothetical protein
MELTSLLSMTRTGKSNLTSPNLMELASLLSMIRIGKSNLT